MRGWYVGLAMGADDRGSRRRRSLIHRVGRLAILGVGGGRGGYDGLQEIPPNICRALLSGSLRGESALPRFSQPLKERIDLAKGHSKAKSECRDLEILTKPPSSPVFSGLHSPITV